MQINVTESELIYIVAALGRVSYPLAVDLYEKLYDHLVIGEKHGAERLAQKMEFS
jgi:hypothetical protein